MLCVLSFILHPVEPPVVEVGGEMESYIPLLDKRVLQRPPLSKLYRNSHGIEVENRESGTQRDALGIHVVARYLEIFLVVESPQTVRHRLQVITGVPSVRYVLDTGAERTAYIGLEGEVSSAGREERIFFEAGTAPVGIEEIEFEPELIPICERDPEAQFIAEVYISQSALGTGIGYTSAKF